MAIAGGAASPAAAAVESDGIIYLIALDDTSPITWFVSRYDMATRRWLARIPLPGQGRGLAVSGDAVFVDLETTVARFSSTGDLVWSVPASGSLAVAGDLLFISGATLQARRTSDGGLLDEAPHSIGPIHSDPGRARVFGWSEGVVAVEYEPDGSLGDVQHSGFDRRLVNARQVTYPMQGGAVAIDGSGTVLDSATLAWRGNLHGRLHGVAASGEGWIAAHDDELKLYDGDLEVTARLPMPSLPLAVFVFEDAAFVLFLGSSYFVLRYPLASFVPEEARPRIDPAEIPPIEWTRSISFDGEDVFYFLAREHQSLLRWSIRQGGFLESIPLVGDASLVFFSERDRRVYVGYKWGLRRIDPNAAAIEERWVDLPGEVCGLAEAGDHLIACQGSGVVADGLVSLGSDGAIADEIGADVWAPSLGWSSIHRQLYFFPAHRRFGAVAIDLEGRFGAIRESPEDFGTNALLVAPDGAPMAGGRLLDPGSLEEILRTFHHIGVWVGSTFITTGVLGIRSFDEAFAETAAVPLESGSYMLFGQESRALLFGRPPQSNDFWVRSYDPLDLDGDGVPTAEDVFPGDATDWADRDGDGVGDNRDSFPDDRTESRDSDGDGVGDNSDRYPYDPAEWLDSDGDRVGDNADAFPFDPEESVDSDGDGIPDHLDPFPVGAPLVGLHLEGLQRAKAKKRGSVSFPIDASLGLLPGGGFTWCVEEQCVTGTWASTDRKGRRYELSFAAEAYPELESYLVGLTRADLFEFASLSLALDAERFKFSVKLNKKKTAANVKLRGSYRAIVNRGESEVDGVWKLRLRRLPLVE